MAIYHCSVKIIGRSKGKSAIAVAAYRAGEKLYDRETGITYDFTRKGGVMHRKILLPGHAPKEYTDRQTLWESVAKVEKKSNAQLAREVEVALPIEFSEELQLAVIREYVQGNFVSEGMCADIAIHDKGNGNPYAHILLTTRPIKADGSWGAKEKEVAKAKRVLQKKLQENCKGVLRRESAKMSGAVLVLIAAYLAQMAAVLIIEKEIIATIPLWFLDRCGNIMWLLQNLGILYRSLYQTMITVMPSPLAVGILVFASAVINLL